MCALSSVARLSVSMTMSMSSGLFSMVEDDSDKDKDDAKDSHHHSNKESSLASDGSTSGHASNVRRHSAPKVLGPANNMSDIDEESVISALSASQRDDSSNNSELANACDPIKSPKNTSGVTIVIDHGSDSDDSLEYTTLNVKDTLLEISDGEEEEDNNAERRVSQFSEVQLLP